MDPRPKRAKKVPGNQRPVLPEGALRMGDHGLRKMLMVTYILIAVIPLLMLAAIFNQTTSTLIRDQVEFSVDNMLMQASTYLDYRFGEVHSLAASLAMGTTLQSILSRPMEGYSNLQQIQDEHSLYTAFTHAEANYNVYRIRLFINQGRLYSNEGIRIFPLEGMPEGVLRDSVLQVGESPNYSLWTTPYRQYYLLNREQEIISYVMAVYDVNAAAGLLGVLVLDLPMQDIQKMLSMARLHDDSIVLLTGPDGSLVASARPETVPETAAQALAGLWCQENELSLDGTRYHVFFRKLAANEWTLVSLVSERSMTQTGDTLGRYVVILILVLVAFSILGAAYMSRANTWRMDKLVLQSQLRALKEQINPHFLYNTLDLINWLAIREKAQSVSALARRLCAFYKQSLGQGEEFVTVADEIGHVRAYVDIQNIRFDNQIALNIDVPGQMLDLLLPRLTLQPIVENAIQHGILEKSVQSGTIAITGEHAGAEAMLHVRDDGVGIAPDALAGLLQGDGTRAGYGLRNIHLRLTLEYGRSYGLRIHSPPGAGTEVTIRFRNDIKHCKERGRT